jgi:hypothetical protein
MGNREQGMGNGEQGMGNREQGTGNREWGTGNGEWGMGNNKQGNVLTLVVTAIIDTLRSKDTEILGSTSPLR